MPGRNFNMDHPLCRYLNDTIQLQAFPTLFCRVHIVSAYPQMRASFLQRQGMAATRSIVLADGQYRLALHDQQRVRFRCLNLAQDAIWPADLKPFQNRPGREAKVHPYRVAGQVAAAGLDLARGGPGRTV